MALRLTYGVVIKDTITEAESKSNSVSARGFVKVYVPDLHGIDHYDMIHDNIKKDKIPDMNNIPWAEVIQPIDYMGYFPDDRLDSTNDDNKPTNKVRSGFGRNIRLRKGTRVWVVYDDDDKNNVVKVIGVVTGYEGFHKKSTSIDIEVKETISGHLIEISDERGKESIKTSHRTGTYEEYLPDASMNRKVKKDDVKYVMGSSTNCIDGDDFNKIGKNSVHEVGESLKISVGDETILGVEKNITIKTKGGQIDIEAGGKITIKPAGDLILDASGQMELKASSTINVNAPIINLNGAVNMGG